MTDPSSQPQPQSAARHDPIIGAFMAIMAEKPFEDIGFAEIARRAGVSLSELRAKHSSKIEMLAAYMREVDRAVLDGIDFRYLKDGEWQMPGVNNLGNLVNALDQTLASLGRTDFDRARALADQLERPEMRLLMEIDLAQVTLGGKITGNQPFGGRIVSGVMTIMN